MKINRVIPLFLIIFLTFSLWAASDSALENKKLGEKYFSEGNYYRAIEYFKAALLLNPVFDKALYGLARTYFRLGEYEESYKFIQNARSFDSHDTSLMIMEGRILTALGEFDSAEEILNNVLDKEPNNSGGKIAMAELLVAKGDILSAMEKYHDTLNYLPNDRRSLLSLVVILDSKGAYKEADKYVSHVLRLYPDNSVVQYTAARHFMLEKKLDMVQYHALAAVKLDNRNQDAVLLLTYVYISQNRLADAKKLLKMVIKNDRNQPVVWYMLGEVSKLAGEKNEALGSYAAAVNLDPGNELIRFAFEEYIMDVTSLTDPLRTKYSKYHFEKGKDFEDKNLYSSAKEEIRRGLQISPHSDDGWIEYAQLLKKAGYKSKYLSILKEVSKNTTEDTLLSDEIEIYSSLLEDSVSHRWNIDQFSLTKPVYNLGLFSAKSKSYDSLFNSDFYINRYLSHLLLGTERVGIGVIEENRSFSEAFSASRNNGCDFFLILDSLERNDTFKITAKMYNGRTGSLLKDFIIYRTGNDRVTRALGKLDDGLKNLLPVRGTLLNRQFNRALVNLGKIDGIEKDMVLTVIKSDRDVTIDKGFNFKIEKSKILGEIKITDTDDLVSEGIIKKYGFFDLISSGNAVLVAKVDESKNPKESTLEKVDTNPREVYKIILTIH